MMQQVAVSTFEEKSLVVKNINLFYDHFLSLFKRNIYDGDELLHDYFNLFCELFLSPDIANNLNRLSVTDIMYIHMGLQVVNEFIHEHRVLVSDDKMYYSDDIEDINGLVINQRWYLLKRTEHFIRKWKIAPAMDPYFTPYYLELIGLKNQ